MVTTPAGAAAAFRATATATTISGDYSNPDVLPLGAVAQVAGQTAQAELDQLGTSTAFASFPYPGDFVVGAPALVSGPAYPLYVKSDQANQPTAEASGPGYTLKATSEERSSTGESNGALADTPVFRSGRGSATATTRVGAGGQVTATATTEVDNITAGGVLAFGRVRSVVTVTADSTGKLTRTSALSVEGATVAGQGIALVDGTFVVGSTKTPLPESPLAQALKDAGVTMTTTRPTDTEDGRIGGSVVVTVTRAAEGAGNSTSTYRLGGAAGFVSLVGEAPSAGAAPPFMPGGDTSADAPASQPDAPVDGAASSEDGTTSDPVTTSTLGGPAATQPGVAPTSLRSALIAAARIPQLADAAWLYFAFIACAAALFASAQLVRQYGVKARL